jgi:hypothetical protein
VSIFFKVVLAALFALVAVPAGYVLYNATFSPDNWAHEGGRTSTRTDAGYHAAPGPIAGAGLPGLAVGLGVYWLVKRRRRKPE